MSKQYEITYADPSTLTFRPNNRNRHSEEQIDRLAKLIKHNGFRVPVLVSKNSGLVVAGHGRLMAAKKIGLESIPVIYQEFESEDEEFQFHVADNAISAWAELDLSGINADLEKYGPFDVDLLGIRDFVIDLAERTELDDKFNGGGGLSKHTLEVQFSNEQDMIEVYDNLLSRGFIVRIK